MIVAVDGCTARRNERFALFTAAGSLLFLVSVLVASPAAALISNVDSADDLCAPATDPCTITQTVETVDGAVLDFGTRALVVGSGGQINAGTGNVFIKAGSFTIDVSGVGLSLKGPNGLGAYESGFCEIEVRRRCSGDTSLLCFNDTICNAAGAGSCSVGSGDVVINGNIDGTSTSPADFSVRAAGDIDVIKNIDVSSTFMDADGGLIELDAEGTVTVDGKLQSDGGALSTGGDICIIGRQEIVVSNTLDVTGGDFDGGTVDLDSDGNVTMHKDVLASATNGEGFGGEINVLASGDITLDDTGLGRRNFKTNGNGDGLGGGGDGGPQCYDADGTVHIGDIVHFQANGAAPDGFGEVIEVDSLEDIYFAADVDSVSGGGAGAGGELDLYADGNIQVTSKAGINLVGTSAGGGIVDFDAGGDLTFDGNADVSGPVDGRGGTADLNSDANLTMSGVITNRGVMVDGVVGTVDIWACRITMLSGAKVDNKGSDGRNTFTVNERFTAQASTTINASTNGINKMIYRSAAKPPTLGGTVTPAPVLVVQASLLGCPVCGNADVDGGETCDDGNTVSGDGCDSMCQDEGCVAGTPGYPATPLCSDANSCTTDACTNAGAGQGTCTHVANFLSCDDGVFCNGSDHCSAGSCSIHAGDPCTNGAECRATCNEAAGQCLDPTGSACADDGNPCTNDTCDGLGTCVHGANSAPCDDGVFCNGADTCSAKACALHAGNPCGGADGDGDCAESCNEAGGACNAPDPNGSACDDGVFCNGADTCIAGSCSGHAGDPCSGAMVCSEQAQSCSAGCMHGDCNGSGMLDAGDPICTVLCLTGAPSAGADCSCAANCNCASGTDAGDPVCAVLRLIGAFSPDTCAGQ